MCAVSANSTGLGVADPEHITERTDVQCVFGIRERGGVQEERAGSPGCGILGAFGVGDVGDVEADISL